MATLTTPTQRAKIRDALLAGEPLTPLSALRRFGCLRLGARVYDLKREGWPITSRLVEHEGKRYAEYRMEARP